MSQPQPVYLVKNMAVRDNRSIGRLLTPEGDVLYILLEVVANDNGGHDASMWIQNPHEIALRDVADQHHSLVVQDRKNFDAAPYKLELEGGE